MKFKRKINNPDGFSLIEVLVAFTILMIGGTMLIPFSFFAIQKNMYNKRIVNARSVAEQFTEQLRAISYSDPLISDDSDTTDLYDFSNPDHIDSVDAENFLYELKWNVAENVPSKDVKSICISVEWVEPGLDIQKNSIAFITYKTSATR